LRPQSRFRAQAILSVGVTLFAVGQSLLFIIVAPVSRAIGLTELQFGMIFTIANLPLMLTSPFWGRQSDKVGRKPIFITGLAGSALGTALMALVLGLGMDQRLTGVMLIVVLIAARMSYGVIASAIYPAATGYMADVTDHAHRARGMAIIGAANSMGSILGPVIGGGLAFLGLLFPLYVASALSLLGCLWAWLFLREPSQHKERRSTGSLRITDARLRPYMIAWATFFLVFISLQFVTAFYVQDRFGVVEPEAVVRVASLALFCMSIVIVVTQGIVLQIVHIAPRTLLVLCAPAFAVALLIMALAQSLAVLIAGYSIVGLAFAFANPGISGSASLAVEPGEQGAAAGYLSASNTAGGLIAPLFGTVLYKLNPVAPLYTGVGIFVALSIYLALSPAARVGRSKTAATTATASMAVTTENDAK
jgi:MFS family permease